MMERGTGLKPVSPAWKAGAQSICQPRKTLFLVFFGCAFYGVAQHSRKANLYDGAQCVLAQRQFKRSTAGLPQCFYTIELSA